MPYIRRLLPAVTCLLLVVACGKDSSSPAPTPTPTPTPTPPAPVVPSTQWSIAGRVVEALSGAPVSGATLEPTGFAGVNSGADGTFIFQSSTFPQFSPYLVTVRAPGYLTREAQVTWQRDRTGVEISLIRAGAPFSLDFYRQLVRNSMEQPDALQPLRRWTTPPSFYIRTIDEDTGRAVPPEVLTLVQDYLVRGVAAWTGWSVPQIQTGPEPRGDAANWIRVVFERRVSTYCGTSFVGRNPGVITLTLDACDCGSLKVPPDTVVHEVGHALGFWHVTDRENVMYPVDPGGCRPAELSPAEKYHAAIAYTRLPGSTDIDKDYNQTGLREPSGTDRDVVVVD